MRALQPEAPSGSSGSLDANHPAMAHAVSVYRSIATDSRPLIRITFSRSGQLEFREEALVDGMLVLHRCADAGASPLPVLTGKALRVVAEAPDPFVLLEVWSPLLKEKHQYRPNLFGTWLPGIESQRKALSGRQFLPKKRRSDMKPHAICRLDDVLVWPLTLDKGEVDDKEGDGFHSMHCIS